MITPVSKQKVDDVNRALKNLGVTDADLREEFIRGSGCGGQKINKTSSCVQLTHLKTGWVIKCQASRSREQNRFLARRILLEKWQKHILGIETAREKQARKIRAQKKKRSQRAKEKMRGEKKHRSEIKKLRKEPRSW